MAVRNPRRHEHSGRPLGLFPIILVGLVCIVASAAAWLATSLPNSTEHTFGPASTELSTIDRYTYSLRLFINEEALTQPADPAGTSTSFEIELGESVNSIGVRLQRQGLIRDADAFRLYLVYAGLDRGVQAGKYEINPRQNAMAIAHTLLDATPKTVTFQILPGWRIEEIAAALPTSGLSIRPEDFLRAARSPSGRTPSNWPEMKTLEGFLFPGSYQLDRNLITDTLLATFMKRFDEKVTPDLQAAFANQNLNLLQAVTLASMIERESIVTDEQPIIASVFLNRLSAGMKLDSDPTVQYALGFNDLQKTWWTNPLSVDDLAYNSAYNTYQNTGLPPGPICNPSLTALQAVAYPAKTPYFYFRARCDGSGRHAFSETYEQHLQNACP